MITSIKNTFANLFNFKGRTTRKNFWWFVLIAFLYKVFYKWYIQLQEYQDAIGGGYFSSTKFWEMIRPTYSTIALILFAFGMLLLFAVSMATVRRLHDSGMSGWWFWLILIPILGWIALLILCCRKTKNEENRFAITEPVQWWKSWKYWLALIAIIIGLMALFALVMLASTMILFLTTPCIQ